MNVEIMKRMGCKDKIELIKAGKCPFCKKDIKSFDDEYSRKEYEISGMCQQCQDDFFDCAY